MELNYKEEFLNLHDFSDSVTKGYLMIFKKVEPLEKKLGKDMKDFDEKDIRKLLKLFSSKSYHSMNVKWSLIKKYMCSYNNNICLEFTQDDLMRYIKNKENASRYISRNTLHNRMKNMVNPQDKAILLLLFEGLFGYEYDEILNLRVDDIDFETNEIIVDNRIVIVSEYTKNILKESMNKKEYYKSFVVGINDSTTNESYVLNGSSPYLIKTKPSKRTKNGLTPLGVEGFKSKIKKILDEIGLGNATPLTIYHSGLIEKILSKEYKIGRELSASEIKKEIIELGARKIQPTGLKKAILLYKKNYKR